jgi:hypothetical protein
VIARFIVVSCRRSSLPIEASAARAAGGRRLTSVRYAGG